MQKEIRIPEYVKINDHTFYAVEMDTPAKMASYLELLRGVQSFEPGIIA